MLFHDDENKSLMLQLSIDCIARAAAAYNTNVAKECYYLVLLPESIDQAMDAGRLMVAGEDPGDLEPIRTDLEYFQWYMGECANEGEKGAKEAQAIGIAALHLIDPDLTETAHYQAGECVGASLYAMDKMAGHAPKKSLLESTDGAWLLEQRTKLRKQYPPL